MHREAVKCENVIHIAVFQIKLKNAYGLNWVMITTILFKQHKITAFDASSQVQTTVLVCCQIAGVQVDLGNNIIRGNCVILFCHAKEINRNIHSNHEETQVHT